MKILDVSVPDGHLCRDVAKLLSQAGYILPNYEPGKRVYTPSINAKHLKVRIRRSLQIAIELARGEVDIGISGLDCFYEFPGAELLLNLEEPATKLVLAIPNLEQCKHVTSFKTFIEYICPGGVTIFSEYPNFARQYIANHPAYTAKYKEPPGLDLGWKIIRTNSPVGIRLSFGSTEGNDFFVDTVETGRTLKANGSRQICVLLERSTPWLAASQRALSNPWKRAKIAEFQSCLRKVLE